MNIKGQRSSLWGQKPNRVAVGIAGWSLTLMLFGCAPIPHQHDPAVDRAMNQIYACEWQHEGNRRPEGCE